MIQPRYYPIQRNWSILRPIYETPLIIKFMYRELERYRFYCSEELGFQYIPKPYNINIRPAHYDNCDWRSYSKKTRREINRVYGSRRGPQPHFWAWVCSGACHWVVSPNLLVISKLEPDRPWQIATSDKHSTIVDIERKLIFDPNYLAFGICPLENWKEQVESEDSNLLPIGQRKH